MEVLSERIGYFRTGVLGTIMTYVDRLNTQAANLNIARKDSSLRYHIIAIDVLG